MKNPLVLVMMLVTFVSCYLSMTGSSKRVVTVSSKELSLSGNSDLIYVVKSVPSNDENDPMIKEHIFASMIFGDVKYSNIYYTIKSSGVLDEAVIAYKTVEDFNNAKKSNAELNGWQLTNDKHRELGFMLVYEHRTIVNYGLHDEKEYSYSEFIKKYFKIKKD